MRPLDCTSTTLTSAWFGPGLKILTSTDAASAAVNGNKKIRSQRRWINEVEGGIALELIGRYRQRNLAR